MPAEYPAGQVDAQRAVGRVPHVNQPDSLRLHYRYNPTDPYLEQALEPDADGEWTTTVLADQVQLTITDTGSWEPPAKEPHRGRGIALMRQLMHEVSINSDTAGTTVHLSARIA